MAAIADAKDRAVHFRSKETGAAYVSAQSFTCQPEVRALNDVRSHLSGQSVEEHLLTAGHLRFVLGTDKHLHLSLADDFDDGLTQQRQIVLLNRFIAEKDLKAQATSFERFRYVAASRCYTTPQGLKDVGYVGNVPPVEFPGPTPGPLEHLGLA